MPAGFRVGLVGHYHGGNQGDDIVVDAVIAGIRARRPDAEIVGFSQAPRDSAWRHGIVAYPAMSSVDPRWVERRGRRAGDRASRSAVPRCLSAAPSRIFREVRFWWRSYKRLRGLDLLVVPGSGQLLDAWRGPRGHPSVFFGWACLARLAGVPLVFLCNGAGPVHTRLGALLLRIAVRSASYVSFRDQGSADVIRQLGIAGSMPVAADLAFTLTAERFPELARAARPSRARPLVGVNAMTHEDPRHMPLGRIERYRRYIVHLAGAVASMVEQGYDVLLFSSDTSDSLAFADAIELLRPALGQALEGHVRVDTASVNSATALLNAIAECDYVVASRYHCALLSCLMGIPAVALAYNQKMFALARSVGLGDYCLDADSFGTPELVDRLQRLAADESCRERMARAIPGRRALAEAEFDRVFGGVQGASLTPWRGHLRGRVRAS
jgi:polysaccharide pyruvyl transferase WcaK-like protein